MDHKAFLAALPADVKTDLTVTGNGPGLRRLAAHGGLIVLAGALIAAGVPGWWLLLPVQGVLIAFLFAAEHECTHRTPFASARLNDWVGRMAGVMLVLPFIPLMIVVAAYLGPSSGNLIAAITLVIWARPARVVRSGLLSPRAMT